MHNQDAAKFACDADRVGGKPAAGIFRRCARCGERILIHEQIPEAGGTLHRECFWRELIGSVAHQKRLCACFGGREREEENSPRADARAAMDFYRKRIAQSN